MQDESKTVILPSGREIRISDAPFKVAKNLEQVIANELKTIGFHSELDELTLYKDIFLLLIGSKAIDEAIQPCLARTLYCGLKLSEDTFEKREAREDYHDICYEVAKANLAPFMKSLSAQFAPILAKLKATPALRPQTTPSSSGAA